MDRGAWGVEVLALLMAYKWLLPHNVFLIRGNHESNIITQVYGFAAELKAKYGKAAKVTQQVNIVAASQAAAATACCTRLQLLCNNECSAGIGCGPESSPRQCLRVAQQQHCNWGQAGLLHALSKRST